MRRPGHVAPGHVAPGHVALALLVSLLTALAAAQAAVIDSTAGLNAALKQGGAYQIAPGEYLLREEVVVRHDLELVGAGRDDVLIAAYGAPVAVWIEGDIDVHLEGLRLFYDADEGADLVVVSGARLTLREVDLGFARYAAPSATSIAGREDGHGSNLALIDGATLVAADVRVAQGQLAGIEARPGTHVVLTEPTIVGNYNGLVLLGDARATVRGGSFSGHFALALLINGHATEADFVDVLFLENGTIDLDRGIDHPATRIGGASVVSFSGGAMRDTVGTGLSMTGAAQVSVRDMTIEGVGGFQEGQQRPWPAVLVEGNARLTLEEATLRGNAGGALNVAEGGALVMRGSRVEGNGGWAHTTIGGNGTAIVQQSSFVANEGTLFVAGGGTLGLFDSNVRGSGAHGIVVAADAAASVAGSVVADHGEDGIWVDGNAYADVATTTVSGNQTGVWLSGEGRAMLVDNAIVENRANGVVAIDASRAALERNRVSGNAGSGVAVIHDASAVLHGNEMIGNERNAVLLGGSASAELEGNTLGHSPVGVRLENDAAAAGSENVFVEVGTQVSDGR